MSDQDLARRIFESGNLAFALVRDGQELARGTRPGIRELLEATLRIGPAAKGASLADKIVGRAVAFAAARAGIASIYTPLGSEAAERVCREQGIAFQPDRLVPVIRNARGDDLCPLEKLTAPLRTPDEAFLALAEFVHLPLAP